MKNTLATLTVLLVSVGLAGCGGGGDSGAGNNGEGAGVDLKAAAESCSPAVKKILDDAASPGGLDPLPVEATIQVGDGGTTVTISNPAEELPFLEDASVAAMTCMLDEAEAPDSVRSEVEQTNGLAGRQQTDWTGVNLSYSYRSGLGFSAVFTKSD